MTLKQAIADAGRVTTDNTAKAWFENIRELYRKPDLDDAAVEARQQEIDDMSLTVEVRTAWYAAGSQQPAPAEFSILLTTGLRVYGELSERCEPENACLLMRDWGVPWREVWPCELNEMGEARAVLLWFAQHFYFSD